MLKISRTKDFAPPRSRTDRGVTTFELLLVLLALLFVVGAAVPICLASRHASHERECSIRLAAIQEGKREVFREMNILLPREYRLRISDRLNPLHLDKLAALTLDTPWRFHPEDLCPAGGEVSVGETFLEPPSCSLGHPIANLEEIPSP